MNDNMNHYLFHLFSKGFKMRRKLISAVELIAYDQLKGLGCEAFLAGPRMLGYSLPHTPAEVYVFVPPECEQEFASTIIESGFTRMNVSPGPTLDYKPAIFNMCGFGILYVYFSTGGKQEYYKRKQEISMIHKYLLETPDTIPLTKGMLDAGMDNEQIYDILKNAANERTIESMENKH